MTAPAYQVARGSVQGRHGAVLPGAVSTAVAELVLGPVREGQLIAVFPSAVYVNLGGTVVAVVARDGVRLPNAVVVPLPRSARPFSGVGGGATVRVGARDVVLGGLSVHAVRQWSPRPLLDRLEPLMLSARLHALQENLAASTRRPGLPTPQQLAKACLDASMAAAARAADELMGLGPGLTPSGDDLLAGTLAGLRLLGGDAAFTTALACHISKVADRRTTALSATLLRCAGRGDVTAEAGDVVKALSGRGSVEDTAARLLAIGHTSGADLAQGLVTGGTAAVSHLRKGAASEHAC